MKKLLLGLFAVAALASANAQIITQWTFEAPTTPADLSNSQTSPSVSASTGTGTASGFHTSTATDWATPAGAGSVDSFSVNTWATNDYWQFSTSTTGFSDINFAWQQTGSGTGPRDFELFYSTDGIAFTSAGSYQVLLNGAPNLSWSSTPGDYSAYSFNFDLSSVSALDNQALVVFRLVNTSTVSIGGGTVAAGGTNRVDNVTVSSVPEPSVAILGVVGVSALLLRRRKL
jgi:hypothetical protein